MPYPGRLGEQGLMGEFFGIHEDNDPRQRLMVIINYNIDIGDYVEWSGENLYNPAVNQRSLQVRDQLHHLRADALGGSRSFVSDAVLDHDVDALQQRDVAQHVAAHGDDVGVLARR